VNHEKEAMSWSLGHVKAAIALQAMAVRTPPPAQNAQFEGGSLSRTRMMRTGRTANTSLR